MEEHEENGKERRGEDDGKSCWKEGWKLMLQNKCPRE